MGRPGMFVALGLIVIDSMEEEEDGGGGGSTSLSESDVDEEEEERGQGQEGVGGSGSIRSSGWVGVLLHGEWAWWAGMNADMSVKCRAGRHVSHKSSTPRSWYLW